MTHLDSNLLDHAVDLAALVMIVDHHEEMVDAARVTMLRDRISAVVGGRDCSAEDVLNHLYDKYGVPGEFNPSSVRPCHIQRLDSPRVYEYKCPINGVVVFDAQDINDAIEQAREYHQELMSGAIG